MGSQSKKSRLLSRRRRGQAMVEYSMVVYALALAGGVAIITVLPMLMRALNIYLNGLYYMINLATP
ncbi:hypothetical protein [Archangium primigenium]|uniref:hypothetical protein n=1 Tax=[Archangium] primigenium TaxID=2792470 RepID=UPI0019568616|nr:hypothetical protein [Archangium primigenium]MBM7114218.1 hypothetical protein [Archangium primigenium]